VAIDATVVLGLAGKATQGFAEEGTYLSFPLAPYGFEQERLRALIDDPLGNDGAEALAEFSLLVNEVPEGQFWQPDGDARLWDVYGDVIDSSELAELPRTSAEEADYQTAYGVLYEIAADGSVVESKLVAAYEQYRDSYLSASQEYNNRKGQAELATDSAIAKQWTLDEPVLLERVTEAEQDWANIGHRADVEDARRLLRELGSRSPVMVWAGYRKLFDPDLPEIFFRTSPEGSAYVPCAYVPSDVIDVSWPTITVTLQELEALAASSPDDLRSRLAGSGDPAIESVSFEYSSVTVSRPWFAPEVFGSRAWRFYDPNRVLSDGNTPPNGECTAYVSGLVLARNITVRCKSTTRGTPDFAFLSAHRRLRRAPVRPYPATLLAARVSTRRAAAPSAPQAAMLATPIAGLAVARPIEVRDHRDTAAARVVRDHRAADPVSAVAVSSAVTRVPPEHARVVATPALTQMIRAVPAVRAPMVAPPPIPPPSGDETTVTSDTNAVYVVAFICRRLPRAPDPDPSFNW